jgi:outer membrane protein OmpA-like peptidoglycan-associated protein
MPAFPHPKIRLKPVVALVLLSLGAVSLSGCATKEFVEQEMGVMSHRIDTLQNLLNAANQRIEGNSTRIHNSENRLGQAEQTSAALGTRIDANLAGLAGGNKRIDNLTSDLSVVGKRIDANAMEITHARERLDGLNGDLAAAGKRIDSNTADISHEREWLDGMRDELTAAGQRIDGNSTESARAHQRLDGVSGELATVTRRLNAAATQSVSPPVTASVSDARPLEEVAHIETAVAAPAIVETQPTGAEPSPVEPPAAAIATPAILIAPAPQSETQAATTTLAAATPGPTEDVHARLQSLAELVAEATQRITANMGKLNTISTRVDGMETGLSETRKHTEAGEQVLQATQARLDEAHGQIDAVVRNAAAQGDAIAQVEKRADVLATGLDAAGKRIDANSESLAVTNTQVAQTAAAIKEHEARMSRDETTVVAVSATAEEALGRAVAAKKLAEGKLVYETVLSEELGNFQLDHAKLPEASKKALGEFAEKLRGENQNVYLEIQGHTDSTGSADFNMRLSRERAEAARDFLHQSGIPMHRMSVIAYGASHPIADNHTRAGRIKNRRVVLVVLK